MKFSLGLKTDPINTRYSFPWLFDFLAEENVREVQIGSFFEIYSLDRAWFECLRAEADRRDIHLRSLFTAHRELGGFFYGDSSMERVARKMCERLIEVGSWLGVDHVGWNPGAVYRDHMERKELGLRRFHHHLKELATYAYEMGIRTLTLEPMSCLAEPPSTPAEITEMMRRAKRDIALGPERASAVLLCGDISHGVADRNGVVVHDNWSLFEHCVPWMAEFHFKNTDSRFDKTFGFGVEERKRGIVDLGRLRQLIERNATRFQVDHLVGYLEIGGPKVGRDYSDPLLRESLRQSVRAIQEVFNGIFEEDTV
jgi:ribulose-phosphate 3-epimerase